MTGLPEFLQALALYLAGKSSLNELALAFRAYWQAQGGQ